MRYRTIKRDSALLEGFVHDRKAIEFLDAALAELKSGGLLMDVRKNLELGLRGKIEDVVYTLAPSRDFVAQMKASNKRYSKANEKRLQPVDNPR